MGSYNVACFVSRLTIDPGDEVYYIPLMNGEELHKKNFGMHYPTDLYQPATLPILGEYNDYGRITPVKNEYTKYLEKKYKLPIEEIVDMNQKLFDGGCFVHKDIFDAIAANYYTGYNGKKGLMYNYEDEYDKFSYIVKKELDRSVDSIKMYNKCKKRPDTDGTEDESIKYYKERIINFDFLFSGAGNVFDYGCRRMDCMVKFMRYSIMRRRYKKEIIDFVKFNHHLYSISTPYIPVPFGEQGGNVFMARVMLRAATAINNKKIKRIRDND